MTNYTIVGTGEINASVSTNFSPSGVPSGAGDQVTFAANQRLVIPGGHTFDSVVVPAAGSSAANRSGFIIEGGGTLVARNDSTWGAYNYLHARGSGLATIDLNGYDIYYSAQTGTNVNNVISTDGTVFLHLKSTAGLSYISQAALTTSVGLLDISNFLIENVSLLFGGRFYPGHHVRVQKGVFYNAGRWETSQYSHRADDFIVDRVLYIGECQNPAFETPLYKIINLRAQNGDATGTTSTNRRITKLVILSDTVTNPLFRMDHCPANIAASHLYTNTSQQISNNVTDWTNCFFYNANVGSIGTSNKWSFCFAAINSNNPHTLELVTTWEDSILESLYGLTGLQTDGGDYLMSGSATANKTGRRSLWIDTYGGAILNTIGTTGGATGTWVLEHCTQVIDCEDAVYGQLIRNENSGYFGAGASVTVQSNILHARSNPSGATSIRAVNMETGGSTQIDTLRNNCLSIPHADLNIVYFNATHGTDDIFENPNFVDEDAGLLSWGDQYGYADYDECCTELMLGVVGYDPTNHVLDDSFLTGRDVTDLIDYVAAAFRPTNPALATTAHDGTTIGAFDYLNVGFSAPLLVNDQTFFGAVVTPGVVNFTAPLVTNEQTFFGATVTPGVANFAAPLVVNSQSFFGAEITPGIANFSAPLLTNSQTFFGGIVNNGDVIFGAPLLVNTQEFFGAVIEPGAVNFSAPLVANSQTFFGGEITQDSINFTAPLVINNQSFFGAEITPGIANFSAPMLTNSQTFFGGQITGGEQTIWFQNLSLTVYYKPRDRRVVAKPLDRTVKFRF